MIIVSENSVNSLKPHCCYSESDLNKLVPVKRIPRRNNKIISSIKIRNLSSTSRQSRQHSFIKQQDESSPPYSQSRFPSPIDANREVNKDNQKQREVPSISNIIAKEGLCKTSNNKSKISKWRWQLFFIVFIDIFYKAMKKHLICPICNDFFRKPKTLPCCGHTFCSTCLSYWFSRNPLRSCPICRRYSTQNQNPLATYSVGSFICKAEKLKRHFERSAPSKNKGRNDLIENQSYQNKRLLQVLGLPQTRNNEILLENVIPGNPQFASKSLENIQKKWAFQQLVSQLRSAQLHATNELAMRRSLQVNWFQKYRQLITKVVKIICPMYPMLSGCIQYVRLIINGRIRIHVRVTRALTTDETCILLIAVTLAMFIFMTFHYILEQGCQQQIKFVLHGTIILIVNNMMNPINNPM